MKKHLPVKLFSLVLVLLVLPALARGTQSSSANRNGANLDWSKIRGVNYVPSYGKNLHEAWSNFDRDAFDRELGLARKVGYNSVRLWLNYFAYRDRGRKMVDDVQTAVELCRKHNLKVLIVLFDGCGVSKQPGSKTMTVKAAYDYFLRNPKLSDKLKEIVKFNYDKYANGVGRDVEVQVSENTSPHVLLWQDWQPSPGYDKLDQRWWPQLSRYVIDVVDRLAGDDTVLAWDLMNEPEFATEEPFTNGMDRPEVKTKVANFLRQIRSVIKRKHPDELVTVGFANLDHTREFGDVADVLTYHVYGDPEALEKSIDQASSIGLKAAKPIFITETLANFAFMPFDVEKVASDDAQLKHYQRVLPTLLKSKIGWMGWGLVVGRIFNPYCDIFYANGYPRPAAIYLENALKEQ